MLIIPTQPEYRNICAYIEYLVASTPSPKTVSNHVSHLRSYLRKAQVSTIEVDNVRVKWALVAVSKDKTYVPRIKEAFPVQLLNQMLHLLPKSKENDIVRAAVLLMYYASLRQSEVLPHSSSSFDHTVHLTRGDVKLQGGAVNVYIKHAKNLQTVYQSKSLSLQPAPSRDSCVVDAVRLVYAACPTLHPNEPCLMFPDSRRPVPIEFVRRRWTAHLKTHDVETASLSLHSLRKAAAIAAHEQGCSALDIQRYGGWRSNAHRSYITSSQQTVNSAIIRALNQ